MVKGSRGGRLVSYEAESVYGGLSFLFSDCGNDDGLGLRLGWEDGWCGWNFLEGKEGC